MITYYKSNETKNSSYEVIGDGKRSLMVVCYISDANPVHLAKLNQIIEAIRYHPQEDTYLCKVEDGGEVPHLSELVLEFKLKHILMFTDNLEMIASNVEYQYYNRYSFEDFEVLIVESIGKIMDDAQRKKKLWNMLQEMFPKNKK